MKHASLKKVMVVVLCVIMVIGQMTMTARATRTSVPGAEGHEVTDMVTGTFSDGYDSTIFVYVTPNASDYIQYKIRESGGFFAVPSHDSSQWYFDGWRTWYTGSLLGLGVTTSDKANPKYDDDESYFEVSPNGFWHDSTIYPEGTMVVLKESSWKGTYYLTAIFKPILTIYAGSGVTYEFSSLNSNKVREGKYAVKYKNGASVSYTLDPRYVVSNIGVNGASYASSDGSVSINEIIRPTSMNINTRLKQQKVKFDANNGSGTMVGQTFEHSAAQNLTINSFVRDGYTFNGWNTKADGSGIEYTDGQSVTFTPLADGDRITLYAQWSRNPVAAENVQISLSQTEFTYNGQEQKPTVTATYDGNILTENTDYTLEWPSDCKNAGEKTVVVTFKGNYSGTAYKTYEIEQANQSAPAGIVKDDETIYGKNDGMISGITANMECRKEDEETYIGVNSSALDNLAAGKYYVRYQGDSNHNPSPDTEVTIAEGRKLTVTVPQNQVGYTLTVDKTEIAYMDGPTIKLIIKDGYAKTESFAVKLNGVDMHWGDFTEIGTQSCTDDIVITVEGVELLDENSAGEPGIGEPESSGGEESSDSEESSGGEESSDSGESQDAEQEIPKTGEHRSLWLWVALAFVSGGMLLGLILGKGEEDNTGKYVKRFGGTKVLIHYGGGSVIKSGLLDRIKTSLKAGIRAFRDFLKSIGMPQTLAELGGKEMKASK